MTRVQNSLPGRLVLIVGLAVAGCGGSDDTPPAGSARADAASAAAAGPALAATDQQQAAAVTQPQRRAPAGVRVEPTRLDLGEMATNSHVTGTIRLINDGTEPVTIQDCKSSCGCTSTNCPRGKALQPGETADVDVRVTGGARAQKINKTVTFRIVDQQPLIVPVSVNVIAYVTIEPRTITPEPGRQGKVVLKATDGTPFRITSMTPPIITEFPAEARLEHEVLISWDAWEELGRKRRLAFDLDHPQARQVTMTVRIMADRDGGQTPPKPAAVVQAELAVRNGEVEALRTHLQQPVVAAQMTELLHLAARHGQVEAIGVLLEAGANASAEDKRGRTPLMAAVQSRKSEAIRFLIEQGADVNARDQLQGTALLRAAGTFGNLETVQVLLAAGAEVNVQDKNGMTPLMWAARWGDAPRVEALVEAGAKVNVRDAAGKTALDWARSRGGRASATIAILEPLTD